MATRVQSIYDQVALIMFENNGFTDGTGIFTDAMFYNAFNDVMNDFLNRTECAKKIINIPMSFGIAAYTEPEVCADVQVTSVDQTHLQRDSGFFLSNQNQTWTIATGQPARWREDENPPRTLRLVPIPDVDGYQVQVNLPGGYGTISSTSVPNDFDITPDIGQRGYGTISGAPSGAIYLETLNPGYGVISDMVSSTGNIQLIAAAIPANESAYQLDYLELIPDSFTPYVVYGVAAKLFSADSEAKDMARANYCQQRYEEGLGVVGAIMEEMALGQGDKP